MTEEGRIVACFRWRGAVALADRSEEYAVAAHAVFTRAESTGAKLVAWHAASFAVAFPREGLEHLVELLTDDDSPALGFSVGIAQGELGSIGGEAGGLTFAWGPPLVMAWALARVARSGEVLLDQIGDISDCIESTDRGDLQVSRSEESIMLGEKITLRDR